MLKANGITHILVAARALVKHFPDDFTYLQLDLADFFTQNLFPHIKHALDFINSGEKVFVHCAEGVSRSPSIIISYLIIEKNMKFQDALDMLVRTKNDVYPNPAFEKQLIDLEKFRASPDFSIEKVAHLPFSYLHFKL